MKYVINVAVQEFYSKEVNEDTLEEIYAKVDHEQDADGIAYDMSCELKEMLIEEAEDTYPDGEDYEIVDDTYGWTMLEEICLDFLKEYHPEHK